jgi:hypothetical protein
VLSNDFVLTDPLYRTGSKVGRGGAVVSTLDRDLVRNLPTTFGREFTAEDMWANSEYFAKAILPVAEEAGVSPALHPDDPPGEAICGVARIFSSTWRAILPGRRTGTEVLDDFVDLVDMAAYITAPTTNTARLATGSPFHCTEKRRQITSDMAQPSRQISTRTPPDTPARSVSMAPVSIRGVPRAFPERAATILPASPSGRLTVCTYATRRRLVLDRNTT